MSRAMAAAWLVVVVFLGVNLASRVHEGLTFRTDLMALLPRDEADPALQRVNDSVALSLSRRVAILVGDPDRARARQAATAITQALTASSLVEVLAPPSGDRLTELGALYFPWREGLLSEDDRLDLLDGRAEALSVRALSQVFGIAGMADARLLRRDPFMLLPAFFSALPLPSSRLGIDEGMLTVTDAGTTWVLVPGRLLGDPYALDIQTRLTAAYDAAAGTARALGPDVRVLHAGAVFFAGAGAKTALADMSTLGTVSSIGTVALVLLVFRAMTPLLLSLLAIGVGMGAGLSVSLLLFGDLHILAMLLGLSLIGIAVDYSLYYCVEMFAPGQRTSRQRLARVMPGITLGLVTTAVGYATFLLAPFPGLRQVAVFSVAGLVASFATVVFWLPLLDHRRGPVGHGGGLLAATALLWRFWEHPPLRPARIAVLTVLAGIGIAGACRISALDDVRRMQSLSPELMSEQVRMQRIADFTIGTQFFVVRAADEETALRREETLMDRLRTPRLAGALLGYRAPASFVPSARRQQQNRELRRTRLETPLLAAYLARIGLSAVESDIVPDGVLTLATAAKVEPLTEVLGDLTVPDAPGVAHIVMLYGVRGADVVSAAAVGIDGVNFVDPAADFSRLLGRYRRRAVMLIAVSAVLMLPLLALRYGMMGAISVMLPATITIVLVPLAKALWGDPFTFFDTMALVLVLSVAVDYAVFCAEADTAYKPVALLGVWMAMASTVLSFGMLVRSQVAAVHAVGGTMLIGAILAFLLAPMAGRRREAESE